jgi:hypothetical protein
MNENISYLIPGVLVGSFFILFGAMYYLGKGD